MMVRLLMYFLPSKSQALLSILSALVFTSAPGVVPATALEGDECGRAIRGLMTDMRPQFEPVRHVSHTIFGGQVTRNISWSTGFNQGMSADADGRPISLFRDGGFYTTDDAGETWNLVRQYSDEENEERVQGMVWQAENASFFDCEGSFAPEGLHEGREGLQLTVEYQLQGSGSAARAIYWMDEESGFVWRTEYTFETDAGLMEVIQDTEPAPDFVLPTP